MMKKHKWYNEIVAWAEGKTIQYKSRDTSVWKDWQDSTYSNIPPFNSAYEFRVKPNTIKYRLYLCNYTDDIVNYARMVYCSNDENIELKNKIENNPTFDKCITDWIEVEL
jgi:hypothetical protein